MGCSATGGDQQQTHDTGPGQQPAIESIPMQRRQTGDRQRMVRFDRQFPEAGRAEDRGVSRQVPWPGCGPGLPASGPTPRASAGGSPSPTPASACRATGASRRSATLEQIGDLRRRHLIGIVGHLARTGQQAEPPQRCRCRIPSVQRRDVHHRPSGLADHKRHGPAVGSTSCHQAGRLSSRWGGRAQSLPRKPW